MTPPSKSLQFASRLLLAICWGLAFIASSPVSAQTASFELPPIDYLNAPVDDAVARLAQRIKAGEQQLRYDDKHGYLPSVLEALDIPINSQTLVFSKTSLQLHRISPRRPRALYFNDDVYVGWCQQGDVLELAATDAKQGAIFYTISQDADKPIEFTRDRGQCLTCHASSRTQDVPGYLVRSVIVDPIGNPKLGSGTYTTDNRTPFDQRFGGWYVTGKHGTMRHRGNFFSLDRDEQSSIDVESGANQTELSKLVRTEPYLRDSSDLVALMVLEHQTQMHNAIAAANYETRMALAQSYQMNELLDRPADFVSDIAERRISASVQRLVDQLLMKNDFAFESPVEGTTSFAKDFSARGPRDQRGRSLRQLDLNVRLFRYPCSYLIYSDAFTALPQQTRLQALKRLRAILENRNPDAEFEHLTPIAKTEILEILEATLPEFSAARAGI
jgi:hypothetical protein